MTADDGARRLLFALVLVLVFMVVEAVGGWLAGSLALLADAGHMLTDAVALALAYAAIWLGRRPPDPRRSYGYRRLEVLAAWTNGVLLTAIALWIMVEAALRLLNPRPVQAALMLAIALVGLAVNVLTLWLLQPGRHEHITIRSALLHVVGDLLGSVAAAAAAVVILASGWLPIDPLLSLAISLLILRSAWTLVKDATHILLEGTPENLDTQTLRTELARAVPAVRDIHHVHAWSLTTGSPLVTLHASLSDGADRDAALRAIKRVLAREFRVDHSVIQLEGGECPDAPHAAPARPSAGANLLAAFGVALGALCLPAFAAERPSDPVTVFAAASLADALTELARDYESGGSGPVTASFAGSAALARQIENGAPADVFISANTTWMDYLARHALVEPSTRRVLVMNRLALVAPKDSALKLTIAPGFRLGEALGPERLAMGDPDHVPAGTYAKAALVWLGAWDGVKDRLALTSDVRAALTLVERGEAGAGIVYTTDVASSPRVRLVGLFPDDSHPPIVYEAAVVTGGTAAGRAFLDFLSGPRSRIVFQKFAFLVPDQSP
ncbi:MAG: molybdate ABC transporter substrate-binding protein [Alphaproteobacteria bacterium]